MSYYTRARSRQHSDPIPGPNPKRSRHEQGGDETLEPEENLQDVGSSQASEMHSGNDEELVITGIRATDLTLGFTRIPAGFYTVVSHSGLEWRTEIKPALVDSDSLEWSGPIPIPSNLSSSISLTVYASFEFLPILGNGERLRVLTATMEQLLDHSAKDISFTPSGDGYEASPCSSILVTVGRRENDALVLQHSSATGSEGKLEEITDQGHNALSLYQKLGERKDLEYAIERFQAVLDLCPSDHPCYAAAGSNLANAKLLHCRAYNSATHLDAVVVLYRNALAARPVGHPDRARTLVNLAEVLLARFKEKQDDVDAADTEALLCEVMNLSSVQSHERRAAALMLESHDGRTEETVKASDELSSQGSPSGSIDLDDLDTLQRTISLLDASLTSDSSRDEQYLIGLSTLSDALYRRFDHLEELRELEDAISKKREVVDLMFDDHPDRPSCLDDLGLYLKNRFERLGDLRDLDEAISQKQSAVYLTPDHHPSKPGYSSSLGTCFFIRFKQLGNINDLEEAISWQRDGAHLTPDDHPDKPSRLGNLGTSFLARFQHLGHMDDLEEAISQQQDAVRLIPDDHPDRLACLTNLATSFGSRFERLGESSDLEEAISRQRDAIYLAPDDHPDKHAYLNNLGISLISRFEHLRELGDLEEALSVQQDAVHLIPDDHPEKPSHLSNLGTSFFTRFERLGEPSNLEDAISNQRAAVLRTCDSHTDRPVYLNNLGNSLATRFEHLGELSDLEEAISQQKDAVRLTPDDHPDKPSHLSDLGTTLLTRFERFGDLCDLEDAISRQREAVRCTPQEDHPSKASHLSNLGTSLVTCFERFGEMSHLEEAISKQREAVALTPDDDLDKPACLSSLGVSFVTRFERLGELGDLEEAISLTQDAVDLTPMDHPNRPTQLYGLSILLGSRFRRLGELTDLQAAISRQQDAISLMPNDHPNKPAYLSNLGTCFLTRFERLGELRDLEDAISKKQDAIHLTPIDHPDRPDLLNDLSTFFRSRFERLGELTDLQAAISRQQDALRLMPDDHPKKPTHSGSLSICFLTRFKRHGDLQDLEEAISREQDAIQLMPDNHPDKPSHSSNLSACFLARFERLGGLRDLEEAISRHREAVHLTPDDDPDKPSHLSDLGNSLFVRFEHLGDLSDLEDAISSQQGAVHLTPDDHPDRPAYLANLATSFRSRFERLGGLSDLEDSILMQRDAKRLILDHPEMPAYLNNLGISLRSRFMRLKELADLEESISTLQDAVDLTPDDHPEKPTYLNNLGISLSCRFEQFGRLSDLEEIARQQQAIRLTPKGHPDLHLYLNNLGMSFGARFEHLGELSDLEEAISRKREAVHLTPDGHPYKPGHLSNLGITLFIRFERLGEMDDLEEAISKQWDAVDLTPDGHPDQPGWLSNLGVSLLARFKRLREPNDLEQIVSVSRHAACAPTGPVSIRFSASLQWIFCSRLLGRQDLLHAYSVAIHLLPQLAWIGLALARRYHELIRGTDVVRDAAAAALDSGRPETAVEWLEQGRSTVWGEMFQLRGSYNELSSAYPDHARRLRELSAALEHASVNREKSMFNPPLEQHLRQERNRMGTLQEAADRHRNFAIKRDKLLQDIRNLPGFERFLLHKEFSQLRGAAHAGPVVMLNAAETRCDALIVLADVDHVIHVPLPNFTLQRCVDLQATSRDFVRQIPVTRDNRDGQPLPQEGSRGWNSTLAPLWKCVVKPILDSLAFSIPGELTRIFWCPTGPFTFLPIHAAGFYDMHHTQPGHKVYDFVVSSYVPTLSILAPTPDPTPSTSLRLLAVRQPLSDGQRKLPGVAAELEHIKMAIGNAPSQVRLVESTTGTVEEVLDLMKEADWVHFACHGVQDPANPTESGLCLADQRRLKLSDAISLSRPHGGLAFLSACQTAKGDEDLPDEAIHIAAGMLYAGYGGVIGTMWSISDQLAPDVAKDVYETLFSNGTGPDYREAALALHAAVKRLRENNVPFVDWLPFIHVGL